MNFQERTHETIFSPFPRTSVMNLSACTEFQDVKQACLVQLALFQSILNIVGCAALHLFS